MNKIIYIFTLIFTISISSQDFQGQAFYKTQTAMDFGSWGDRMSAEQKKAMKERMKPFLEPVYILTFDKTKSIYQQEERLDAPGSGDGRVQSKSKADFLSLSHESSDAFNNTRITSSLYKSSSESTFA